MMYTQTRVSVLKPLGCRRHSCDIEAIPTIRAHRNVTSSSLQDLQHAIHQSILYKERSEQRRGRQEFTRLLSAFTAYQIPHPGICRPKWISQIPSYENHHDIPLSSDDGYIHDGEASLANPNLRHMSGIKSVSLFTHIPTISFIVSVHAFSPPELLCTLFNSSYVKDQSLNKHAASLPNSEWTAFGVDTAKIESPTSWGCPPRDILRSMGSFEGENLYNFSVYYMLSLIQQRV